MIYSALNTKLSVPPKPAAIFDGDVSRKFGIVAPRPTAIDASPRHSRTQVNWCTPIINSGTRSIRSLKKISAAQGTHEPTDAKKNLLHKIVSLRIGSRPRIQKH